MSKTQPTGSWMSWSNTEYNPIGDMHTQTLNAWEDGYASGIKQVEETARKNIHIEGFKPMQNRLPLTIEQIAELFDCKMSTLDTNANIFKLIDAVRKVEKAHGIN